MITADILVGQFRVQLSLNPNNTYTIIRVFNNERQETLIAHIPAAKVESTMQLILDHEVPQPNVRFMIEQD